MDGNVNDLPVCHKKVATEPQILLNPVYFFKCVASCLSFAFLLRHPTKMTQKSYDNNRLSDTRLQKKSVNFPKLVLEQQQEEPMAFYH